jgi:hypothetical protein
VDNISLYSDAERQAIERHKYFMSQERGEDVGLDAAEADWRLHHSEAWQRDRHAEMLAIQREEISKHKWIRSEEADCDLGRDAAFEWIDKYASSWRQWYEQGTA